MMTEFTLTWIDAQQRVHVLPLVLLVSLPLPLVLLMSLLLLLVLLVPLLLLLTLSVLPSTTTKQLIRAQL